MKFWQYWKNKRGSILAWSALALIPMLGFTGVSVDGARAYLVKSRLSQAIDAAALAGGKTLNTGDFNSDITKYFHANYPDNYLGSTLDGPHIVVGNNNETVTVDATAHVPTTFARMIGQDYVNVYAKATVRRQINGMELALVMDNTGSMLGNGKMDAMKANATLLINTLYGSRETMENFWVSLVPYVSMVNIGNQHTDWLTGYVPGNYSPTTWKGCVEARAAPYDATDDKPSARPFTPALWKSTYTTPVGCTRATVPPASCDFGSTTSQCNTGSDTNCDNDWPRLYQNVTITRSSNTARVTTPLPHNLYTGMTVEMGGATQSAYNGWKTIKVVNPNKFTYTVSGNPATPATGTPRVNFNAIDDRNTSQNYGYGPNLGCATPITSLVAEKTTVLNAISAMNSWSRGGTFSNEALAWGWRTISPNWRGLWGGPTPANLPLDYESKNMNKVIVILTDGVNEVYDNPPAGPNGSDYTSYGRLGEGRMGSTNKTTATSNINSRMASMCETLKQKKIIIYTILVQENDPATQTLFRNCATDPQHFFPTPDNATLQAAFKTIGEQLSNLRIQE